MKRKEIIQNIIKEKPEAILVKNKYKVLVGVIRRIYPNSFEKISPKIWEDIIFDAVNGNRDWQMLTEGYDKENKQKLDQQWRVDNGYIPNFNKVDIKD